MPPETVEREAIFEYWIGRKKVTVVGGAFNAWRDVTDEIQIPFRNKILEDRVFGDIHLSADLGQNGGTTVYASSYAILKKIKLRNSLYVKAIEVNPVKQRLRLKIRSEEGTPVPKEVTAPVDGIFFTIGREYKQIRAGILLDEDFAGAPILGWISYYPVSWERVRGFTERPHHRRKGSRNYGYVAGRVYDSPNIPVYGWIAPPDVKESIIYGFIDGTNMMAITATVLTNNSEYNLYISTEGARFQIPPGESAVIPGIKAYRSLLDRFKMNDPYITGTRMHNIFRIVDLRLSTLLIEKTQEEMSSLLSYYASVEKPVVITALPF